MKLPVIQDSMVTVRWQKLAIITWQLLRSRHNVTSCILLLWEFCSSDLYHKV